MINACCCVLCYPCWSIYNWQITFTKLATSIDSKARFPLIAQLLYNIYCTSQKLLHNQNRDRSLRQRTTKTYNICCVTVVQYNSCTTVVRQLYD